MSRFLFVEESGDELIKIMFQDLEKQGNVTIIPSILPFSLKVSELAGDIGTRFYKWKICQYVFYVLQRMTVHLKELPEGGKDTYLVFTNSTARGVSVYYLRYLLRKYKNLIPVMLYIDIREKYRSEYANLLVADIPQFRCLTFDEGDAEKYGYVHTRNIYSLTDIHTQRRKKDVYFCFTGKNRLKKVKKIAAYFRSHGVDYEFFMAGERKCPAELKDGTSGIRFFKKRRPYHEILEDMYGANCLLEVTAPGQKGVTLRYYEAVCYNKKLLTNNPNIAKLPFYNPRYMKIFQKIEEIDCEWITETETVDYGYDGRFSPVQLLREIEGKEAAGKSL
jgi:hypothetical protein